MAKATIAVALLAIALLAGSVTAAQSRRLLGATASATGTNSAVGGTAGSFNNVGTFNIPSAAAAIGGGASYGITWKNGKPSISTAIGQGTSSTVNGISSTQGKVSTKTNGNPGTSAGESIQVGSSQYNAASAILAQAESLGGGK